MINLNTSLTELPRLGTKYADKLKKLGLITAGDLLFHFPYRYDDYTQIVPIASLEKDEPVTIIGTITQITSTRSWKRRMNITEAFIEDSTGLCRLIWFNQPYITKSLREGRKIRISGKVQFDSKGCLFNSPDWELASRTPTNTACLVPIYQATSGITPKYLRWQIQMLLDRKLNIPDPIPDELRDELNLPPIEKALQYIHFPKNIQQAILAEKRFSFYEMLLVQLKSIQIRLSWQKEKAQSTKFNEKLIKKFVSGLPFILTDAQRKSSFQILKDLEKDQPMNRLLNGDVGSGKTIVAAIPSLQNSQVKHQTVIMAPTEVLALQHFEGFSKLFKDYPYKLALLTNSYKIIWDPDLGQIETQRKVILKQLQSGEISVVIGTHSLIQKDIRFHKLTLVIIDEQHRFGVNQRAYLQQKSTQINDGIKNKIPHFLTMTATPIPRTLALAFFGNVDLSILDQMPAKRKPIKTQLLHSTQSQQAFDFIKKEIKKGRQAFIIFPLVDESEKMSEVKAAISEHKRLAENIFPDLKLGLLHGKMKSAEKEKVMQEFKNKKTDILVATSVVEVGIDVPNATVIVIENADRFGLSQLHQFRGRVGRGEHQSYCYLISESEKEKSIHRLEAFASTNNGFEIAEKDLEIRGPGQFFGTRQSGLPDSAMKNLSNIRMIQIAREKAKDILQQDPRLNHHPIIKKELKKFDEEIHLE